jgi:hypothetical protein
MWVVLDWTGGPPSNEWSWQDAKVVARPWDSDGTGLNLAYWDNLEFDVRVLTNVSTLHPFHYSYGLIQCVGQGDPYWGNNDSNGVNWQELGTITLSTNGAGSGAWTHCSVPCLPFQGKTLSTLIFNQANFGPTNGTTMHTELLIDNVQFTSAGKPPFMRYTRANRGLNIWSSPGGTDRNSIQTPAGADGPPFYMWAGNGAASYSFTIANYPSDPSRIGLITRLLLIPNGATEGAPDWNEPNCIMMDLDIDTNGIASWFFRWKTNMPNSNGQYYDAGAQVMITNSTVLGKWTLSFSDDTHVTMTAPGGNSTSFQLGVTVPGIPDISPAFYEPSTNHGVVYLGLFGGSGNPTNDLAVVFSAAQLNGMITQVSNNWLAETNLDPNSWVPVAGAYTYVVPTNNAWWVSWTLPDGGFALQTNTVGLGSAASWSTNHGLPLGTVFRTTKGILVKPGDLPVTPRLYFRMSRPGF